MNRASGFNLRRHFDNQCDRATLDPKSSVAWHPSQRGTIFFPSNITTEGGWVGAPQVKILAMTMGYEEPVAQFPQFTEPNLSVETYDNQPFMAVKNGLCQGSVILMAQPDYRIS